MKQWRVTIADVVNLYLEQAGCAARIHPDRLDERNVMRAPEPKLLPSESRTYREGGVVSDTMAEVLAIRAQRTDTYLSEQANARAYWQERKTVLGITDPMDLPAQLAAVCAARAQVRDHAPAREVVLGEVGVERDDRMLGDLAGEAYAQAWDEAQASWRAVEAQEQGAGWPSVEHALQDLARQLEALSAEAGSPGQVRIRLWDQEQGRGLS